MIYRISFLRPRQPWSFSIINLELSVGVAHSLGLAYFSIMTQVLISICFKTFVKSILIVGSNMFS